MPSEIYKRKNDDYETECSRLKEEMLLTKQEMQNEEDFGNSLKDELENLYGDVALKAYLYDQLAKVSQQMFRVDSIGEDISCFTQSLQHLNHIQTQQADDNELIKALRRLHPKLVKQPKMLVKDSLEDYSDSDRPHNRRQNDETKIQNAFRDNQCTEDNLADSIFGDSVEVAKIVQQSLLQLSRSDLPFRQQLSGNIYEDVRKEVEELGQQVGELKIEIMKLSETDQNEQQDPERTEQFLNVYQKALEIEIEKLHQEKHQADKKLTSVALPELLQQFLAFVPDKFQEQHQDLDGANNLQMVKEISLQLQEVVQKIREMASFYYKNQIFLNLELVDPKFIAELTQALEALQSQLSFYSNISSKLKSVAAQNDMDAAIEVVDLCQTAPQGQVVNQTECQYSQTFVIFEKLMKDIELVIPHEIGQKMAVFDSSQITRFVQLISKAQDIQTCMCQTMHDVLQHEDKRFFNEFMTSHPFLKIGQDFLKIINRTYDSFERTLQASEKSLDANSVDNQLSVKTLLELTKSEIFWFSQRQYLCMVCWKDVVDHVLPCGHLLCDRCCQAILEKRGQQRKCVYCNEPLSQYENGVKITKMGLE